MIARRHFLIAGGAGLGLALAWAAWPREYAGNLAAAPGETVLGAWLKIGIDGQVTVAVPQAEHGQGVYTALPQILADELGADWRTVGVEAAPINPLFANPLAAQSLFGAAWGVLPDALRDTFVTRSAMMLTGGSTSVRMFESALRDAGAAARALLCQAAAARWGVDWADCDTQGGFVIHGDRRERFGALAAAAADQAVPDDLSLRFGGEGRLSGRSLPRLDSPAKVDGSANYAADVRLPDMVFASVRHGPIGASRLIGVDHAAADRVRGALSVIERPDWVAVAATDWWSADRALAALAPRFETRGDAIDDATIAAALEAAFDGPGTRIATAGDLSTVFRGASVVSAAYHAAPGLHAAIEPPAATAWWRGDRLELWAQTQAPTALRDAAARATGIAPAAITVHPMLIGGSFGAALEHRVAVEAAILSVAMKRPVQVAWSRAESIAQDAVRAPAHARMTARLAANGAILGWQTKIAAPATGRALGARLMAGERLTATLADLPGGDDPYATTGAVPPYRIPALAVDHHHAALPLTTGHLRGGAHGYTAFFTECFLDELALASGSEPMSYRIGMLGGDARLARCLTTAAALGGWDGGVAGSGQGIACHMMADSYVAVLAEAHVDERRRIRVDRLIAAVDCGRQINPDLVRQQIEGGLIFGMAQALGATLSVERNLATARTLAAIDLPALADSPDILIEVIPSLAEPGGVSEIGVPAVAPAIANAIRSATGVRLRALPLRMR